jgi:L-seryl-tRNA(Ser) seleniumtransferase
MASGTDNPYRLLPSVDEVLRDASVAPLAPEVGRAVLRTFAQRLVEAWREEIRAGDLDAQGLEARLAGGGLGEAMRSLVERDRARGIRRAVNVSGVVLNTGLGRAPVHAEVAARMEEAARSFCVLEVDRVSGERNRRDDRISELLGRLVGCEAGIAVNNNAGAALLTMHALATGQEAVVSRGELVEIGGSFRVPEVMAAAGVRLVEVGATNRTRIEDYEAALTAETGLLMKVHPSNFRVVGFTSEVDPAAMAELGRRREVATAWDLGSGLIELPTMSPLGERVGGETEVAQAVDSGVDVVTFSGDKLLGAPQAGLCVGRREAIARLRRDPMYRALRCDKVTLAGLEATLELLLAGRGDELPARRMLLAEGESLEPVAQRVASALRELGFDARPEPGQSQPGSGSAPGVFLAGPVVRVVDPARSAGTLAAALRAMDPPVFARVHDDAVRVDPRTLLPGDEEALLAAFARLAGSAG